MSSLKIDFLHKKTTQVPLFTHGSSSASLNERNSLPREMRTVFPLLGNLPPDLDEGL